jgi:hypothetical protein
MNILVACEFSGIVRDAFIARGHNAWSCDLLPTENPGNHIQDNILDVLDDYSEKDENGWWDLMIAHPPCTDLAVSGARWMNLKGYNRIVRSINFFMALVNAPIPKIAIENPIGIMSTKYRKPDHIIQPWMFGHGETKATCLWLKNLPKLEPTNIVEGREARVHKEAPGPHRWKNRSRTYQGIANAMVEQWGELPQQAGEQK